MADESMTELIDEYNRVKYGSKPAKKMRKKISKVLVLNEMEQRKAQGIRENIKGVFNFINSGSPAIPVFDGKEDFADTLEKAGVLEKIASTAIFVALLPVIALKMGVKTVKLASWMLEKPKIVEQLKREGLYDNIVRYAQADKEKYQNLNSQEYMDHLFGTESYQYNDLMDEMSDEMNGKGRAA